MNKKKGRKILQLLQAAAAHHQVAVKMNNLETNFMKHPWAQQENTQAPIAIRLLNNQKNICKSLMQFKL